MTDLAAARFDLIAPLLRRYKRRFTLLDLGAGINPYMAQRISREFDCVLVAIEQGEIAPEELAKFGPRALWLRKKMSAEDLERLACCEHFDVALALNILHHHQDWFQFATQLNRLCDFAICQTPYPNDSGTCGQDIAPEIYEFLSSRGRLLGESVQFDRHLPRPLYLLLSTASGRLSMTNWDSPVGCISARIHSRFDDKQLELPHKSLTRFRRFIHGLNLWNFAQLNGQWPRKERVLQLIRDFPLPAEHHGDIVPHNFIFDGTELHLIDGHEGWEFDDKENLIKTEKMMEEVLT